MCESTITQIVTNTHRITTANTLKLLTTGRAPVGNSLGNVSVGQHRVPLHPLAVSTVVYEVVHAAILWPRQIDLHGHGLSPALHREEGLQRVRRQELDVTAGRGEELRQRLPSLCTQGTNKRKEVHAKTAQHHTRRKYASYAYRCWQ